MVKFGRLLFTWLSLCLDLLFAHVTDFNLLPNELVKCELAPKLRWDGIVALARTNKHYWKGACGQMTRQWFKQGVDLDTSIEASIARILHSVDLLFNLGLFFETELYKELDLFNTPTRRKEKIRHMLKFVDLVKLVQLFPLTRDPELKFENQEKIMGICDIKHGTTQFTMLDMVVFGAAIRPSSIDMSSSLVSTMTEHSKFLLMNHARSKDIRLENHDLHIPEIISEVFFLYCWSIGFYTWKHIDIYVFNRLITTGFHEFTLWKILESWRHVETEIDGLTPEEIGMLFGNVLEAGHGDDLVRVMFRRAVSKRIVKDPYSVDRIMQTITRSYPHLLTQATSHLNEFIAS